MPHPARCDCILGPDILHCCPFRFMGSRAPAGHLSPVSRPSRLKISVLVTFEADQGKLVDIHGNRALLRFWLHRDGSRRYTDGRASSEQILGTAGYQMHSPCCFLYTFSSFRLQRHCGGPGAICRSLDIHVRQCAP